MSTALVVGGAACVWEDSIAALKLFCPDAILLINSIIPRWPARADYAISLHPEHMDKWLTERQRCIKRTKERLAVWSYKRRGTIIEHVTPDWAGSSGLFAVKVALEQGFDGIVVAGVPMSAKQNHFLRREKWTSADLFLKGWIKRMPEFANKVRSMSGWTMQHLGAPTPEWLASIGAEPADQNLVAQVEKANGWTEDNSRKS